LANAPSVIQRIAEGWQLSTVFSWISGSPLSFTSPLTSISQRTSTNNTADLVGALPDDLGKVERDPATGTVQYFSNLTVTPAPVPGFLGSALANNFTNQVVRDRASNSIILQNPGPGSAGNLAANLSLDGPAQLGLDMALTKRVRIGETKSFSLRADAINILNRPNWGSPNVNINGSTFGRITTATGNRTITFNARIDF
jgi:hypothetical protein